jgi:DNA-binding response OmpR family regulator
MPLHSSWVSFVEEKPKILIVDDAPDFCEALALLLDDAGYNCKVAQNGRHAIELLTQHTPDLVMIDWEMPIMNGAEFLRNRMLHPELQGVPVVVVSARDVRSTAETLGASFLLKPFSLERLLPLIENLLETRAA